MNKSKYRSIIKMSTMIIEFQSWLEGQKLLTKTYNTHDFESLISLAYLNGAGNANVDVSTIHGMLFEDKNVHLRDAAKELVSKIKKVPKANPGEINIGLQKTSTSASSGGAIPKNVKVTIIRNSNVQSEEQGITGTDNQDIDRVEKSSVEGAVYNKSDPTMMAILNELKEIRVIMVNQNKSIDALKSAVSAIDIKIMASLKTFEASKMISLPPASIGAPLQHTGKSNIAQCINLPAGQIQPIHKNPKKIAF